MMMDFITVQLQYKCVDRESDCKEHVNCYSCLQFQLLFATYVKNLKLIKAYPLLQLKFKKKG